MGAQKSKLQAPIHRTRHELTGGMPLDYEKYLQMVEDAKKKKLAAYYRITKQNIEDAGQMTPAVATAFRKEIMDQIRKIRSDENNAVRSIDNLSGTPAMTAEQFQDPFHNVLTKPQFDAYIEFLRTDKDDANRQRLLDLKHAFDQERARMDTVSQRLLTQ